MAIHPVVHIRIDAGAPLAVTEDARRQWSLRRDSAAILEYGNLLLEINGDGNSLAQLARPLSIAADDWINQIKTEVIGRGSDAGQQPYALLLHRVADVGVAFAGKTNRLIETFRYHDGPVVISLQKLVPTRDALLVETEHHLVDERQALAGIVQQPGRTILRFTLGGI